MIESTVKQHFGTTLKALRQAKGLSQEQLAERAETQANYISMIESGKRQPTVAKVFSLASGLEMSVADLMRYVEASIAGKLDTTPRITK